MEWSGGYWNNAYILVIWSLASWKKVVPSPVLVKYEGVPFGNVVNSLHNGSRLMVLECDVTYSGEIQYLVPLNHSYVCFIISETIHTIQKPA